MPVAVELTAPAWLLAWPLLAAFLWLARLPWWRAAWPAGSIARRREARRLAFRLTWAALLVFALAGATLVLPLRRPATVFVLDASASLATVRDQVAAVARAAGAERRGEERIGVVAAAEGARIEERPTERPTFSRLVSDLPVTASDLAAGLRLAGAILPDGFVGRVVLVSDGRQTRGDAVAAARELAARGVTVDVLPLGASDPDVRVEAVTLPETASLGEVATLSVQVAASRATRARLGVFRDDQFLIERALDLHPGRQAVALPVPVGESGLHRYRVAITVEEPGADSLAVNNELSAVQRVVGPPRVLIVAGQPSEAGLLPEALEVGGAHVTITGPAGVPADLAGWARYDAVVLANVPAEALPGGSLDLLERYVQDLGRGLVMTGGPDSFGPGGYAETPVERALPVSMDVRGRGREPTVALGLVIDKSGSMSGIKVEMAKEAAVRSLRLLRPADQAAVLAFDAVPQWVASLTPLAERERLEGAVGQIYAAGGTEIYPAVAAGFAALRDVEADVKHLILLTDGRSGSGGEYPALLDQLRAARVSLSAIAVGEDADTGLLDALARAGRGRYYFVRDPTTIPEIFSRETLLARRTILVEGRFTPAAASAGPLLRGLSSVPPLDGYVAVSPKERAEVVLVSPEGDPVLAAWQYGAGRSVAWTPDLAGRWSGAWAASPAATLLWGNVLSWLLPAPEGGALTVQVAASGEESIAIVVESPSGWDQVHPTRAVLMGPDGQSQEVDLSPAGPGRYRAEVETPAPGAYLVQASQTLGDGGDLRGETGWVAPYPAEYRDSGVQSALLREVAAAGAGQVLESADDLLRPPGRSAVTRWSLAPLLVILAALAWPLEIATRRLPVATVLSRLPLLSGTPSPRRERALSSSPAGSAPATRSARAAATTQHLLARKRAFQEDQRERLR